MFVWCFGSILAYSLSKIAHKISHVDITICETIGPSSIHHVFLELSLILFQIAESALSQTIFLPIDEHAHIDLAVKVMFLSLAVGNAADGDSFEYGLIRQLKLAVYLLKLLQVLYPLQWELWLVRSWLTSRMETVLWRWRVDKLAPLRISVPFRATSCFS